MAVWIDQHSERELMSAKGKIGRLPYDIRQKLNQRMRDGEPDINIVEWINGLKGVKDALSGAAFGGAKKSRPAITPQNLSEYRAGEYQKWLKDQDHVEKIKTLSEFSFRLAEASGGNVSKSAVSIAAGRMMELLEVATEEDLMGLSKALTGLSMAESTALRVQVDQSRLGVQQQAQALDEAKFQRTTAELFLKWYGNKRAQEIADGKGTKDVQIEQLRMLMFGETDNGDSKQFTT